MLKPLTEWLTTNCGKFLKGWEYDHLIGFLRNLYAGQNTTQLELDMEQQIQIGKGVCQCCILSPCLFNLCAEYITRNARLDKAKARCNTARINTNNLRYTDDTTLMAESEEELNCLFMKLKEESEKAGI